MPRAEVGIGGVHHSWHSTRGMSCSCLVLTPMELVLAPMEHVKLLSRVYCAHALYVGSQVTKCPVVGGTSATNATYGGLRVYVLNGDLSSEWQIG